MIARVLIALKDRDLEGRLRSQLHEPDVLVETVRRKDALWKRISAASPDLLIVGRPLLPEPLADTIQLLRDLPDAPGVIVLTDETTPEEQASLIAAGCEAALSARLSTKSIARVAQRVLSERSDLAQRGIASRRPIAVPRLSDFVSSGPAMQSFMTVVRRVVTSDVSLLIQGETGVGKERLARAIHAEGPRASGPFIAVNCGALPEHLLESELFGHEEGAFTGATRARRGWFELAHAGTIFLDEIGELASHLQVKLLRVLQEHEIQRVGSEKHITADVRVMAATNRDLDVEVEAGRFRRDLFYRLSVVTLTIPPLRERQEDIAELVESYIVYLRPRVGRPVTGITSEALTALTHYTWPGNVRELINVIERAMLLCEDEEIALGDLPAAIRGAGPADVTTLFSRPSADDAVPDAWLERPLAEVREELLKRFERAYLAGLLRETQGRIGETARRAGIRPRSLYDKMKRLGLRKEEFRRSNVAR